MKYVYIYMLTLDVVMSCYMVAGDELMYLEVLSMEKYLSMHGQMKST